MKKEESNFFKGIALLMMLFVHTNSSLLVSFMEFSGKSIWSYFYMANTPVVLFLILSGYGFYSVSQKERDRNYLFRLFKLFLHFWIIFLILIPLTQTAVNTDFKTVLYNVTGWHVSWNGTCWFIFPYVMLAATYKYIYAVGKKIGWIKLLLASFVLYLICGFIASRYHISYDTAAPYLYNVVYLLMSQFPFIAGMCLNKYQGICFGVKESRVAGSEQSNRLAVWGGAILIVLIGVKCIIKTTSFDTVYAVLLIILMKRTFACRNVLLETLGKHSLNIWMAHAFLLTYVNKYQYDVLFLIALLGFSYMFSVVVNIIAAPMEGMFMKGIDFIQKKISKRQ